MVHLYQRRLETSLHSCPNQKKMRAKNVPEDKVSRRDTLSSGVVGQNLQQRSYTVTLELLTWSKGHPLDQCHASYWECHS